MKLLTQMFILPLQPSRGMQNVLWWMKETEIVHPTTDNERVRWVHRFVFMIPLIAVAYSIDPRKQRACLINVFRSSGSWHYWHFRIA